MAITYVDDTEMFNIAESIRGKLGTNITYKPSQFAIVLAGLDVVKNDLASLLDRTLTSYETDDLTIVKEYGFAYCKSIHTINLGGCTTLSSHALYGCSNLKVLGLPNVTTIGESAMSGCEHLSSLVLPKVTSIGQFAFYGCNRLHDLILEGNTVPTVASSNFLNNTLIASGTGFIHVPSNLVATYQAASGWSTYAAQIIAIT